MQRLWPGERALCIVPGQTQPLWVRDQGRAWGARLSQALGRGDFHKESLPGPLASPN